MFFTSRLVLFLLLAVFCFSQIPGAVGDGVADDTAAFQAAINQGCTQGTEPPGPEFMPIPGGTVRIPKPSKYYRLNGTLLMPVMCSLALVGDQLPALYWPTAQIGIDARYSVMPRIEGIRFKGGGTDTNHGTQVAVSMSSIGMGMDTGPYFTLISRNVFHNWGGASIDITTSGAFQPRIRDNQFFTYGHGILVRGHTDSADIMGNQMDTRWGACVLFDTPQGAGQVRVEHNNMICRGGGVIARSVGMLILRDNYYEQPHASIYNNRHAGFLIDSAARVIFDNNHCNLLGKGDICYFVGDGPTYWINAKSNTSVGTTQVGWRLPSGHAGIHFANDNIHGGSGPLVQYGGGVVYSVPPQPGGAMAFSYKRSITIDYTKVGGTSNLTDFPVLVSFTNNDLRTVANGGKVQNSSGHDIAFYSDEALTTPLKWEMDRYVATTGQVIAWVKIPTLSYTANTVIYMAYGDSSISTFQSTASDVWDSNHKAVYHLGDGTTLGLSDSTANAYTLTNYSSTAETGVVSGGVGFAHPTPSAALATPSNADFRMTKATSVTAEFWLKTTQSGLGYQMANGGSSFYFLMAGGGVLYCYLYDATFATEMTVHSGSAFNNGAWRHVVWTYDGSVSADGIKLYVDGDPVTPTIVTNNFSGEMGTTGGITIGETSTQHMDEIRWSKGIARSAGWIKTNYNSQNSPSTFFTLGSEQVHSAAARRLTLLGVG